MAKIEYDSDPLDGNEQIDEIVGIVNNSSLVTVEGVEYTIASNDDGMVYRVVEVKDERKMNVTGSSGATTLPANCQYVLIDSTNGIIQALTTPTMTGTMIGSAADDSHIIRPRPSVSIAPKAVDVEVTTKLAAAAANAQAIVGDAPPTTFKKRDDRRRETHNAVERRRRDKINHLIMKLGSIIPADGSSLEVGGNDRISIAAVEGQSKGGILSKACEYVQALQDRLASSNDGSLRTNERVYEVELIRLRQENAFLKEILRKNGIECEFDGASSDIS